MPTAMPICTSRACAKTSSTATTGWSNSPMQRPAPGWRCRCGVRARPWATATWTATWIYTWPITRILIRLRCGPWGRSGRAATCSSARWACPRCRTCSTATRARASLPMRRPPAASVGPTRAMGLPYSSLTATTTAIWTCMSPTTPRPISSIATPATAPLSKWGYRPMPRWGKRGWRRPAWARLGAITTTMATATCWSPTLRTTTTRFIAIPVAVLLRT